ncbi:helix-turn-helix domain-containing protein [Streptomyces albiaxialis]|uniref:Helix-turn-helix domain-containing protein n=2 Tax=Streptomyces albiaxialis TaxID=329523 RepID=A0ABP5HEP8_9ACTN
MADHRRHPHRRQRQATHSAPLIGGVPVDVRLGRAVPALARRMVALFTERLPTYAMLPGEELAGDITRACEENLRVVVRSLRTGRFPSPGDGELEELARSASRRAEEGIPLSAVLSAYHLGWRLGLDEVLADAGPEDLPAVLEVQDLLLEQLQLVTSVVTDAYQEVREAVHGQELAARHALLSALLDGQDAAEAAQRAGLRRAPAYTVLTLALGEHPDEHRPGVSAAVAARRKVHRAQAELDHHTRGEALYALGPHGGRVLLPAEEPERALHEGWPELTGLLARVASRAGARVHAGVAAAAHDAVAGAVRESEEVLGVVRASGRAPGAYRVLDVLIDYQLSRPGPARDRLAGLLAPLRGHPVLLETLRTYAAHAFSRRATAEALHVHPNTVDYRLRRVTRLTGLETASQPGLLELQAALTAYGVSEGA